MPRPVNVELSSVRKRFGRRAPWILDGVDLELPAGSTTVVVGANGAGKSTMLRIVAGLLDPTTGRVDGRPTSIGYAPDRLGSRVRMSARTYVEHMARLRGLPRDRNHGAAEEMLDRLGLLPGPDAPIRSLSKGNSQKVALAQALIAPVDLLILDEPYGGLDGVARDAVSTIVAERGAQGTAVVISAHAPLDLIGPMSTLVLERGRLRTTAAASPAPAPISVLGVHIVLAAAAADADPGALGAQPGVLEAHIDGTTTTLRVVPAASDAVLAYALAHGYSVVSVTQDADVGGHPDRMSPA